MLFSLWIVAQALWQIIWQVTVLSVILAILGGVILSLSNWNQCVNEGEGE